MILNNCICNNIKNQLQQNISYICNKEYQYFLNKGNVQGVGLGYKVKNSFRTRQLCIQVFVSKKLPQSYLNNKDIIPSVYKGIPTDVKETGYFTPCSLTQRVRPVLGGYTISANENQQIYSTAGCLVTNGVSKFVLSTNHALAKLNTLPIGSPIIQPSPIYGGFAPNDTIATLHKYIPLRFIQGEHEPGNFSDCALGLLTKPNIMSSTIALIGKLNGVKSPKLNQHVRKVGATSELTEGVVTSVGVNFRLNYPNGQSALFRDQIFTTHMSERGDSGALLINNNNFAIGILVSKAADVSTFSRLSTVLDQLDVQLVTT